MKTTAQDVVVGIVLTVLLFLVVGGILNFIVGDSSEPEIVIPPQQKLDTKVTPAPQPPVVKAPLPAPKREKEVSYKNIFVASCTQEGRSLMYSEGWYPYCNCCWNYLYNKYGLEGILESGDALMDEAVDVCLHHLVK